MSALPSHYYRDPSESLDQIRAERKRDAKRAEIKRLKKQRKIRRLVKLAKSGKGKT